MFNRLSIRKEAGIHDPGIFKAIFFVGSPGSGKTTIQNSLGLNPLGLKVLDQDDITTSLLSRLNLPFRFDQMDDDQRLQLRMIRDEAKGLTRSREDLYLKGRLGLLIDGTGKSMNHQVDHKRDLEEAGYDTFMIFVENTLEGCIQRNKQRGAEGGRQLKDEDVINIWKTLHNFINEYKNLFGSHFICVENVGPLEMQSDTLAEVRRALVHFVQSPITNPNALKWIEMAKEQRQKQRGF